MLNDVVNIELHTDNNYVLATLVTLASLFKNKNRDSVYNVKVLGNNLTEENINLIKQFDVTVIPHSTSLGKFEGTHLFVSSTDLFKFDLPNVLADWDKVLYLDTDIIVKEDLTKLFNTDLKDNYAAVVKDMPGMVVEHNDLRLNLHNYFNAGIMLLNLKKMREDNVSDKLIDYKLNDDNGRFMSQDALNFVFAEKVIFLHPKYNFMSPNLTRFTKQEICSFFNIPSEDLNNLKNKIVILHLTNKTKPWNTIKAKDFNIWYKYFRLLPESNFKKEFDEKFKKERFDNFLKILFSVGNEQGKNNKIYKIVRILGIKIKFTKKENK